MERTEKKCFFRKFIGDKKFYLMVLSIAIPIMIQNGITNFVSLLDNIMIGRIGTEPMSGAAIVNQLIFVYNLCIFGGVSGAGIFTAQYFGKGDQEGVRNTMRYKLWMVIIITAATIVLLLTQGDALIHMYLKGEGTVAQVADTLRYGREYLDIIVWGLPAFMMVQVYASTLRECGETMLPMKAGVAAVVVNLFFNFMLIYGMLFFPKMGVRGAALATVISRYVEVLIVMGWTHRHHAKHVFAEGLYRTMRVPAAMTRRILIQGTPLLLNETFWAAGMAMLTQCYSIRGLNVVAGLNISNTVNNVFNIVFIALGDSVAIVVGQLLGAGKMMLVLAPLFPNLYNTNAEARELAKYFIIITAIFMPQNAFLHASYFTLRSGGRTIITFLFDSVFIWVVSVSVAFTLSRFTALPVLAIYALVQAADFIKCIIGFILVKKGVWLRNIVTS